MLIIDEAIVSLRKSAGKSLDYEWQREQYQIAEWLEELKEFREISKKNPFLVDMIKHDRIVRSKAIDDLSNTLKENYDYIPQILSQEAFDGYIDEYAEQLKAGDINGT